ncbi:hypothetical protein PI27_gp024 [Listeria phage WIL-1]|nr:hypothetical protein PI27_gp024 [Listeria phage WIL-1]
MVGFEPTTSRLQSGYSNQTELHPVGSVHKPFNCTAYFFD